MTLAARLLVALVCLMETPLPSPLQDQLHSYGDYHQHLFSPAIAERANIQPVSAQDLVTLLDEAGIERAVVLSLAYQYGNPNRPPVENEYERVKAENDWTSKEVARFPNRLVGFCSVNPLRDYALEEIDRCAKDPQLRRGLKMHFGNSDVDLLNPQHVKLLQAVFRSANNHRMALVVHMRATVSQKRPYGTAQGRAFLAEVLPFAPDVPVQIAHLAGAGGYDDRLADEVMAVFVDAIAARDARVAKILFDVSGVAGLGQWKTKMDLIVRRIREVGVERVLYGSDGAGGKNPTPRQAWAAFLELPLTKDEVRTIAKNVAPYMR
jgi:predicted TIM-barrel fold metal-dependent hydrolase